MPGADACERFIHAIDLSAHIQKRAARQLRFELVHDFVHLTCHATEVTALYVGKHVEDRLHVIVIPDDRRLPALDRRKICE